VHRYGKQDELLTDAVAPLLDDLRDDGALARAFFLRYWQGGPHVRLRLLLADGAADAALDETTRRLRGYLTAYPSTAGFDAAVYPEAQDYLAGLEGETATALAPPDTLRPARYEPEYAKYGGPRGVAIAEELFDRSSAATLDLLPGLTRRPRRRLTAGFAAMLGGLRAAGLAPTEMAAFLANYCVYWSPYVFERTAEAWPALLARQHTALNTQVAAVLDRPACDGPSGVFAAAMAAAVDAVRRVAGEVLPAITLVGPDATAERRYQVLVISYLHTHNNRLGLIPESEAFLAYLGHHAVSEVAGLTAEPDLDRGAERYQRSRRAAG
jgi:thiopeptide-type bacteriocin biosynthesis protein